MRRDTRRRPDNQNWWDDKRILLSGALVAVVLIIGVAISISSNNGENSASRGGDNPSQIISLAPEDEIDSNTESASSSIGNKVEENQTVNETDTKANNSTNTNKANTTSAKETAEKINQNKTNTQNEESKASSVTENETTPTSGETKKNENLVFDWPVKGDLLKAFSIDNLLYSSTLQEWTVHNGIDIKADKAAVVCAVADGTVKSIKNDPRYGLTVIIEHADGFKTVYSNLLTTEFVVEGEKVSKGQSIGTVGNTANFEVADDFHLHFEILKDDEYVDPMIYLK